VRPLPPRPADEPQPAPKAPVRRGRAAAGENAARSPLTPETWVDAATEVLVNQGIDHVRVDVLAQQLQVTRGSFYWHFRDREDLLRQVLQAWAARNTEQLTRRLTDAGRSPQERLRDVVSLPFRGRAAQRAARIELAIRAWARRDPMAQAALDAADAARLAYHASIFADLGLPAEESRARAFMLYSYEVAESLLVRQGSPADKADRRAWVERMALLPPGPAAG
jgi:AcrR family transcriptional regulator